MQLSITTQTLFHPAFPDELHLTRLTNRHGLEVLLSNYGASIWSVKLNDHSGNSVDLALNYENIEDWATNPYYFGITVGRVANRIAAAQFPLNQQRVKLAANEGNNQLHGGPQGLSHCLWQSETAQDSDSVTATFNIISPDGDQGFPGELHVKVEYRLNDNNELIISYHAMSDETTPVCLTNHTYWNLAKDKQNGILDHVLQLNTSHILALDAAQVPNGELLPVDNSAFDFRQAKSIAQDIHGLENGYDHFFVLDKSLASSTTHLISDRALTSIAVLSDPISKREMEISTTELGVQFYSGNFLDGSYLDTHGEALTQFRGLCLETHGYPNAVNIPHFPSMMLEKGQQYTQITVHKFKNI